jgi:predicted MPP superfamily phosphohydrolase
MKIINSDKVHGEIDILQISDLHLYRNMNKNRYERIVNNIRKTIEEKTPDIIFLTGDYLDHEDGASRLRELLSCLKAKYGKFAVLGNHDFLVYNILHIFRIFGVLDRRKTDTSKVIGLLEEFGVAVLRDETAEIRINGDDVYITGAEPWTIKKRLAEKLKIPGGEGLKILLSHYPDAILQFASKADIVFSGHTHGGQVTFFGIPFVTSSRIKGKRAVGLTLHNGSWLYVSRGCGSSRYLPFRFFARPEINRILIQEG